MRNALFIAFAAMLSLSAADAKAFCGFYVAKADGDLFNAASRVVYARDGDRSVITMASDYRGAASEFAMVVPTPVVLTERQVHVTRASIVEHLDAYTAPRLVEYYDDNPCRPILRERVLSMTAAAPMADAGVGEKVLGVTVEAAYSVGEYDIQILSATQSDGLAEWLTANGYRLPDGAAAALAPYISAGMKFFVAKVNLAAHDKIGGGFLRPLQIAFESPDFMLPIRLGMLNSKGSQDLLLYTITRSGSGRVETANYRTVPMPTNVDVPLFVEQEFADVYRAGFANVVNREGGAAVVMEYAWNMNWCDPCAADPLPPEDLVELGAFWMLDSAGNAGRRIGPRGADAFVTRLHARYDAKHFPEDLMLRITGDPENFQGRYVLRHPWTGDDKCAASREYFAGLAAKFEKEAANLANFTRWPISEIREKMKASGQDASARPEPRPWWERIWPKN